jgi:hypothetical protein
MAVAVPLKLSSINFKNCARVGNMPIEHPVYRAAFDSGIHFHALVA